MNKRLVIKMVGLVLIIEAVFLLLPLIISLAYKESDWYVFLIPSLIAGIMGTLMFRVKLKAKKLYSKEGFTIVVLAWVLMSLIGALPYTISGILPDYLNAIFESVSGFTTSGITIIADVEIASHGILFWRSLTHWLGGMGVLVFMLAVSPVIGGSSVHLMRAESPGPVTEKITPKINSTAKWLYGIYIILTLAEIIALSIAGLSVFHATLISFGTLATGGFSYLNSSLAAFTMVQQGIVTVFMILAGINFSLFFLVAIGKFKKAIKDIELRYYLIIMGVGAVLVFLNVMNLREQFSTVGEALHHSIFAVASGMTSTGFAAADYNAFPWFAKGVILVLMFVGGCAGSTGGGLKVSRIILGFKAVKRYIKESIRPRSVQGIKYNGKPLSDDVVRSTMMYFILFTIIFAASVFIVSTNKNMDFSTSFASVSTAINNNGIEFRNANVGGAYTLEWWIRLTYIIDMLIGRLEVLPIVVVVGTLIQGSRETLKKSKRGSLK